MPATTAPKDTSTNLQQGIAVLHATVERFKAYCEREMKANPHEWPPTMTEAEWFEQFLCFTTSGADAGTSACDACGAQHSSGANTLCDN